MLILRFFLILIRCCVAVQTDLTLLLLTYVIEFVPGLNKAFPEGEDATAPSWEKNHGLGQRQHVVDRSDEAQRILRDFLLQAAQPGLKQDGGDTCRGVETIKHCPLPSTLHLYYYCSNSHLQSRTCRAQQPDLKQWPGPHCDFGGARCDSADLQPPGG